MMRQNAFFVIFKELSVARESLRAQSEPLNHWVKSSAFLYWSIRNLLHKTVVDFVKYKFIDSPKFCFYRIDKIDCDKIVYKILLMIFQCKKTQFFSLFISILFKVFIYLFSIKCLPFLLITFLIFSRVFCMLTWWRFSTDFHALPLTIL